MISSSHLHGREHRVPLSPAAMAVLETMKKLRRDDYVFPGLKKGKPLSNMAMLKLLERMGRSDLTAHGFRSTFRDWAAARVLPRLELDLLSSRTI